MTKKNILYLDDVTINHKVFKPFLENNGYSLIAAKTIIEAQNIFMTEDKIDLILSDINVGQENGLDFLKWARERKQDIPAIVISAFPSEDNVFKAASLGIKTFLSKPVDLKNLLEKIKAELPE